MGCGQGQIIAGFESFSARRICDDPQCTGLRARPVESALGASNCFNAGDVIHVDIEYPANRRDRLVIKVDGYTWARAGFVAIAARGDTSHEDLRIAGALTGKRHARQKRNIVFEVGNTLTFKFRAAEDVDADRDVLQVFGALLSGDRNRLQLHRGSFVGITLLCVRRRAHDHAGDCED